MAHQVAMYFQSRNSQGTVTHLSRSEYSSCVIIRKDFFLCLAGEWHLQDNSAQVLVVILFFLYLFTYICSFRIFLSDVASRKVVGKELAGSARIQLRKSSISLRDEDVLTLTVSLEYLRMIGK